jgi:hypothetical protein
LTFVGTTDLCTHLHKVSHSIMGCVLLQGVLLFSLYFLYEFDNFSFIFLRILHEEKSAYRLQSHVTGVYEILLMP